ncbi:MAG TPA: 4-alpha-glucanotransferase [Myxococcales bacterium]|jgi:4-alpha-glucanotransferase
MSSREPIQLERCAGVLVPLFSLRTAGSWGLGELPDLARLAPWMRTAGLRVAMTLPLLEVALGQTSPYSALSAFALEPAFLALDEIEDFRELGGESALEADESSELDRLRQSEQVDWNGVRRLKGRWLRRSFDRFVSSGAAKDSSRARDLASFREQERGWLYDYGLFRALKHAHPDSWWRGAWPAELARRNPASLARARERHAGDIAFYEYLQWLAHRQLEAARAEARREGVLLAGDLPFMVAEDSADAWSRQAELRFDATVGAPPDDYSKEGQDWGLPAYRWDVMERGGYEWLRRRGESAAGAFDLVRVDHAVGFYRTYTRPRDGSAPFFSPAREPEQIHQGEAVFLLLRSGGTFVFAEDLGSVPKYVRQSLTRVGVPGFRVLRWEKDAEVYRDPGEWPALSVATTGTHDTDPLPTWWESLPLAERAAVCKLPALQAVETQRHFTPAVHDALLETVYRSGSRLLLPPMQDLFGWRERVNVPGTVGEANWTWRMRPAVGDLTWEPALAERAHALRRLGEQSGRA